MTNSDIELKEPPSKRIRSGDDFFSLVDDCYELQFSIKNKSDDQVMKLKAGIDHIREALGKGKGEVSFGSTRFQQKITWGKCVGLMLESGSDSLNALKVLHDRHAPGGGLLGGDNFEPPERRIN